VDQLTNSIYNGARYRLPLALLDWTNIDLMLTAWSGTPTFVPTDVYLSDIVAHGLVERGSSLPISSKSVSPDGTAQTNEVIIPAVPIGTPLTFFTMSERKPTHALSELILFIDEAFDLPFDPNGLDVIVQPDWLNRRGWWKA
jgi:hypothetical protein